MAHKSPGNEGNVSSTAKRSPELRGYHMLVHSEDRPYIIDASSVQAGMADLFC